MFTFACLLIVLIAVVMAVTITLAVRAQNRRRQRLQGWAAHYGWAYDTVCPAWATRLGRGRFNFQLTGILEGRQVSLGQYTVTTGAGDSSSDHPYTAVVVTLSRPLPDIAVTARGAISSLGLHMFGPGETATGINRFDDHYRIRATDPGLIPNWCGPQLIDAHLAGAVPVPWNVHGWELTHVEPGVLDPDRAAARARQLLPLINLLESADLPQR